MIRIYHNPRCRKSREALGLLEESGMEFEVVDYLKKPLNATELQNLCGKLDLKPQDIVRKGEIEFKENFKGKLLTDDQWFSALEKYPKLLERPIVENGNLAALGRPPENILKIL